VMTVGKGEHLITSLRASSPMGDRQPKLLKPTARGS
jgi:hypothetical protein